MHFFKILFFILFLLSLGLALQAESINEAREFQREVQELERQRTLAHDKLSAEGATPAEHRALDNETLRKSRLLESKRTNALKKLGENAGVGTIEQGEYGTQPSKGRGALGDVDTKSYSPREYEKIRNTAKKSGYTVEVDGDTLYIKELDTTVHREATKYKSKLGSSPGEAETARGYAKESSRYLENKNSHIEVLDNLGKNGHTLNKPIKDMTSTDWQEIGKMTGRNMKATNLKDRKFQEQLLELKKGYLPESLGIDDLEAFQKKCRDMNNRALKNAKTRAKNTELNLEKNLVNANTPDEISKAQHELKEHRQTQKAAEDSYQKNKPEKIKSNQTTDDIIPDIEADELAAIKDVKVKSTTIKGKKTYVASLKDVGKTAASGIMIFSTAQDIKEILQGKKSAKELADMASLGSVSIIDQLITKNKDFDSMVSLTEETQKLENEYYVINMGLKLRKAGVSKKETLDIMEYMHMGDNDYLHEKLHELHEKGIDIKLGAPKQVGLIEADDSYSSRAYAVLSELALALPTRAWQFLTEAGEDVYYIGSEMTDTAVLYELLIDRYKNELDALEYIKKQYNNSSVDKSKIGIGTKDQNKTKDPFQTSNINTSLSPDLNSTNDNTTIPQAVDNNGSLACYSDSDCPIGKICSDNSCITLDIPDCLSDTDCAEGESCRDETCVMLPPPECLSDSDCPSGETCSDQLCIMAIPDCISDSDCASGEICSAETCTVYIPECTSNSECASNQICKNETCIKAPPIACESDHDCPLDKICSLSNICVASANGGYNENVWGDKEADREQKVSDKYAQDTEQEILDRYNRDDMDKERDERMGQLAQNNTERNAGHSHTEDTRPPKPTNSSSRPEPSKPSKSTSTSNSEKSKLKYYVVKESSRLLNRTSICNTTTYAIVGPIDLKGINDYVKQQNKYAQKKKSRYGYPIYTKISVSKDGGSTTRPATRTPINKCTSCPAGQHIGLDKDKQKCHGEKTTANFSKLSNFGKASQKGSW